MDYKSLGFNWWFPLPTCPTIPYSKLEIKSPMLKVYICQVHNAYFQLSSRYFQSFSVGPFRVTLISCDQLKILHQERLRYDKDSSRNKPPRFLVETDASGGMCAQIKNLNCDKRINNYAIVKAVGIPGDTSSKTVISFADMITNDHSSRNISVFYKELKDKFVDEFSYWPPFEGLFFRIIFHSVSFFSLFV